MNEETIETKYATLIRKYNSVVRQNMALKRKVKAQDRENTFLNRCLVILTLAVMALAILILR